MDKTQENKIKDILETIQQKRQEYGDVDSKIVNILKEIYPDGISADNLADCLFVIHELEKLLRFSSSQANEKTKIEARKDLAGYAVLSLTREQKKKRNRMEIDLDKKSSREITDAFNHERSVTIHLKKDSELDNLREGKDPEGKLIDISHCGTRKRF